MVSGQDGDSDAIYAIDYSEDDITEVDIHQLKEDISSGSLKFV